MNLRRCASKLFFVSIVVAVSGPAMLYANTKAKGKTSTIKVGSGATVSGTTSKNTTLENVTISTSSAANLRNLTLSAVNLQVTSGSGAGTNSSVSGSSSSVVPTEGVTRDNVALGGAITLTAKNEYLECVPGGGTLTYNKNALIITTGSSVTASSPLRHKAAGDVQFFNKLILNTDWTFEDDGYMNGHGGVLDLTNGGTLRMTAGTSLALQDMTIRGIGIGRIIFDDDTAEMRLSNVTLEMNRDYTFTTGNIYVEGPTTIVTANHTLTLSQAMSMSIDNVTLFYDTLSYPDQMNIVPNLAQDTNHKNVISIQNGVIRHVDDPTQGDAHYTGNSVLGGLTVVHDNRKLVFDQTLTLNGQTQTLLFAKSATTILSVAASKVATINNATLEYFSPSYVSLGSGAQLQFGAATKITLGKNEDLSSTWTFRGACTIDGGGHVLNLSAAGALVAHGAGAALMLENMTIKGLSGSQMRCTDNTGTFSFNNVVLVMDGNYTMTLGHFDVMNRLDVVGSYTWTYRSTKASVIQSGASMKLDYGVTFSYAPTSNSRSLLSFTDATSFLELRGATLASTTTGLQLLKGTVILDHKNYVYNDLARSVSQAVTFGNNNATNDVNIVILPGGSINPLSGILAYQNTA